MLYMKVFIVLCDLKYLLNLFQQYGPRAPINELDSNGCTPLMYAAMADSVLGIEMLLSFSARREKVGKLKTMCK